MVEGEEPPRVRRIKDLAEPPERLLEMGRDGHCLPVLQQIAAVPAPPSRDLS